MVIRKFKLVMVMSFILKTERVGDLLNWVFKAQKISTSQITLMMERVAMNAAIFLMLEGQQDQSK